MPLHKFFGMLACIAFLSVIALHLSKNPNTSDLIYLYIALIILIALYVVSYLYYNRCKKCGKWGVMKVFEKKLVDERSSTITKTIHHNYGGKSHSEQIIVPATLYTYHWHRRCKECGHEDYVVREKKKAD